MKMKFLFVAILLGVGISCSNEFDAKPGPKVEVLPKEDWYSKIGVDYISKNEALSRKVKAEIKKSGLDNFSAAYASETYHLVSGYSSHMIASKVDPNEFLVVTQVSETKFNLLIMKKSEKEVTYVERSGRVLARLDLETKNVSTISGKTNVEYPGNCSELGPRRSYEDFGDCFLRNTENFCCDFTGCLAMVSMPGSVATAITVACSLFEEDEPVE